MNGHECVLVHRELRHRFVSVQFKVRDVLNGRARWNPPAMFYARVNGRVADQVWNRIREFGW
jgi:hypothetical protein